MSKRSASICACLRSISMGCTTESGRKANNFVPLFSHMTPGIVDCVAHKGEASMARLRLEISEDAYLQLIKIAVAERRPADWQAEVILEQAIAHYGIAML